MNNAIKKRKTPFREEVPRVSLGDFRKNILELKRLCERNGSSLVIISPPLCKERSLGCERTPYIIRYRQKLEDTVIEYGIHYLYIEEMTERSKLPTIKYFSDIVHPNVLGNKLIMKKLYDYLIAHDLLPGPTRGNSALTR
jgi:hypothetical protein